MTQKALHVGQEIESRQKIQRARPEKTERKQLDRGTELQEMKNPIVLFMGRGVASNMLFK